MACKILDCQVCQRPIEKEFIEGIVEAMGNKYLTMCAHCHKQYGNGLGVGRGQRFKKKKGKWVRVNN